MGGYPLNFEKTDKFGGSIALSGGVLWARNSDPVKRAGFGRAPADSARAESVRISKQCLIQCQ
jgi:hypothetical protein